MAALLIAGALLPWMSRLELSRARGDLAARRADAAIARARSARALNPLAAAPLIVESEAERLRGDASGRLAAARRAVALQPENPEAWRALARAERGRPAGAAWRRVARLSRGDAEAAAALTGNLIRNPAFMSRAVPWGSFHGRVRRVEDAGGHAVVVTRETGTIYTIDDYPDSVPTAPARSGFRAWAAVRAASPSAVGKPVCVVLREQTLASIALRDRQGCGRLDRRIRWLTVTLRTDDAVRLVDVFVAQWHARAGDAMLLKRVVLRRVRAGPAGAPAHRPGSSPDGTRTRRDRAPAASTAGRPGAVAVRPAP
jgi:hypothetical protein